MFLGIFAVRNNFDDIKIQLRDTNKKYLFIYYLRNANEFLLSPFFSFFSRIPEISLRFFMLNWRGNFFISISNPCSNLERQKAEIERHTEEDFVLEWKVSRASRALIKVKENARSVGLDALWGLSIDLDWQNPGHKQQRATQFQTSGTECVSEATRRKEKGICRHPIDMHWRCGFFKQSVTLSFRLAQTFWRRTFSIVDKAFKHIRRKCHYEIINLSQLQFATCFIYLGSASQKSSKGS